MKKYQKPTIQIVPIRHSGIICTSNPQVRSINSGDTGIIYDGGSSGPARGKGRSIWDDDWSEYTFPRKSPDL